MPVAAALDPERVLYQSRLVHWFASPPEGKRVVWVGDSTTYLMDIVANGGLWRVNDDYMNTYVNPPGGALHGVVNVWMGANGNPLDWFLKNGPVGMGLADVIAADGDLYIFSYGINDVREGRRNQQQLTADIITAIDAIRAARPNADIVLRTPNSFLTTDAAGLHFVTPITAAQEYTDILRNSYLSVKDRWPNVVLLDQQEEIFGATSQASSTLMKDQIHPGNEGFARIFSRLAALIGK